MDKLRKLIEQSGKSQTQVAKELGISPPRLNYYVQGKREPDNNMLSLLADYFGVSVDCLLDREQKKTAPQEDSLNPLDKYYMDLFGKLNEDQQGVVLALIRTLSERK